MDNKKRWTALWISFFAMSFMFIPYVGYSIITIDLMEEFSINYTQISLIASIAAISAGLTLPFAGHYVDKYGPKKIMLVGIGILAIGQLVFAFAPSFGLLLFSRAILGVGIGLMIIAPYTMALLWFKESNSAGLGLGIMLGTDSIGILMSNYLLAIVLNAISWRMGMFWTSIVLIVLGLFVALSLKNPPIKKGEHPDNTNSLSIRDFINTLTNRNVIGATIYLIGLFSIFSLAVYWIPTILIEERGWSAELSGFISTTFALAGFLGAFLFGIYSDKLKRRKIFITVGNLSGVVIFAIVSYVYSLENYILLAALLPVSGLLGYGGASVAYTIAAESVGDKKAGLANGIVAGAGIFLGTVIIPTILGYVKDITGSYLFGFLSLALFLGIVSILSFLFLRDLKATTPINEGEIKGGKI
ncbi:Sugar phosphate permease, partial [Alteribacillus persepolensis]